MEVVYEYWFVFIFLAMLLIYAIIDGIGKTAGKRDFLSVIIIIGIIALPILLDLSNQTMQAIYYIYLGGVLICAYLVPDKAFIFRGLVGVSETFFFPRSKHWLLIVALALIILPLMEIMQG